MKYTYLPSDNNDTICAISTASGAGAIALIRISGPDTFKLLKQLFRPKNKTLDLNKVAGFTMHLGDLYDGIDMIDEILLGVFRAPNSYTGEDLAEISCHGSPYIQKKILELLINNNIRLAKAGEFTLRAFLNGKYDLSQAEAVADLIASNSKTSHDLAINQMRGCYSIKIKDLRDQLVNFASLLELELDFSEEDVEFASRANLHELLFTIKKEIIILIDSFALGNVLKEGIPVTIIGKPNVGKSTLLNAILNEERAIVSETPGTTRDFIEDTITIQGINFRFVDTAGIHDSQDRIEKIGIERTFEKIRQSKIVLYVFDVSEVSCDEIENTLKEFREFLRKNISEPGTENKKFILIGNKTDQLVESPKGMKELFDLDCVFASAKRKENIDLIIEKLIKAVDSEQYIDSTIVSSVRHFEALNKALESIDAVEEGINSNISTDLIAIDMRNALFHLGEITGEVTNDELLENIFGRFCIGK